MKFFVYLISIILIIALTGLFVFKQPNGQTWLSVDGFLPHTQIINEKINLATNKLLEVFENYKPKKASKVKIYRWRDNNGNWSYSDKPNASIESEEVFFDQKDIVVLPALDVPTIDLSSSTSKGKHDEVSPNILIIAPSKVFELYKDTNNVQKLMDERQHKISKAIQDSTG